eukprot:COSAG01_NODE_2799_length_7053_cov_21.482456_10_plen_67_part_00
MLEHLLREISGLQADGRGDGVHAAGLVGRQLHATHMYRLRVIKYHNQNSVHWLRFTYVFFFLFFSF